MLYKIGCFLVRGISFPAAQLFVIAIENILRGGVVNLTRSTVHSPRRIWIVEPSYAEVSDPFEVSRFVGKLFFIFWGNQAGMRVLDNRVLARTSDS